MKTTTNNKNTNEELCDIDCECHENVKQDLKEIGNNVWIDANGGSGPSKKMQDLIAKKMMKKLDK